MPPNPMPLPPPPLNPLIVQGKGRPKGAIVTSNPRKRRAPKGYGITSIKRLASSFEIAQAEEQRDAIPASSAPPILDRYEPGTAHPRSSQRYHEALVDEPDEPDEELALPTRFEGVIDELLELKVL